MEKSFGTVKFYDVKKAYGFVISDDETKEEFFFHLKESKYSDINKGDKVSFHVVKSINKPGSLIAVDLTLE